VKPLVAGVRCSFPGEDAGSVHIRRYGRDCVTRAELVGEQRGPAAQTVLRLTLLRLHYIRLLELRCPETASNGRVSPIAS
jgi:hypothetical protein